MNWIALTYSLPTGPRSSPRVAIWRRLRRLGAVALSGAYFLPASEECQEAFQWLAQEIRQAQGEACILVVSQIDGMSDGELIELFRSARRKEYAELEEQALAIEQQFTAEQTDRQRFLDELERLRRRLNEVARVDYFRTPEGEQFAQRLARLATLLVSGAPQGAVVPAALAAYQGRIWVTRPRPHVDRLACAWLIRRFIDATATIRYSDAIGPEEVGFDMEGGEFSHIGNLCTFEALIRRFELRDPALQTLAEIVHAIDLRDAQYAHPEVNGLDRVLAGWLTLEASDEEREAWGRALFEGLYQSLRQG